MKKGNTIINALKKTLALVLVAALAFTLAQPLTAQAKAKKVTLDKQGFTTDLEKIQSCAKEVKKGNTVIVLKHPQNKTYEGYAKFTAPATKTYTITYSNLKPERKKGYCNGHITGYFISGQTITDAKLIKSGYEHSIHLANEKFMGAVTSKTVKVKLEKGQTLYLLHSFLNNKKPKSVTVDLKIK
ncbi:MAG: hypothetical protein E7302_10145 [Butyrivibrio sp.]|nr:hypothetical protein [Butyrivibrio sp.]